MTLIVDLCGGTGSWSLPYVQKGYDVVVVDPATICKTGAVVLPLTVEALEQDVDSPFHSLSIHGVLAAPPCTHFSFGGVSWWKAKDEAGVTLDALGTVMCCLRLIERWQPNFWALENPIGRLRTLMPQLGKPTLVFQPFDYGDAYHKKTQLWGKFNIPKKTPVKSFRSMTKQFDGTDHPLYQRGLGRKVARAITPLGFAFAFADSNP